jgi:uncharacterized protein DUF4434
MKNWQCQEDLDIKTIPSGEVFENDRLEIRFQVRNLSDQKRNIKVKLYLDEIVDEQLINEQLITAEANKFGFGNHFYNTKGNCGDHQIKVVLEFDDERLILNENIKILPYRDNVLNGGFIMIGPPNDRIPCDTFRSDVKSLTDKQWQEQVDSWNEIGLKTLIITAAYQPISIASEELQAHYPSKLMPKTYDLAADDPFKAILSAAEKNGQQVFIGLGHFKEFERIDEMIAEIYEYYKGFKSFYGWYASYEASQAWSYWGTIGNYWKKIKNKIAQLCPVMPVLASPWPGTSTSFSYNKDQPSLKGINPGLENFLLENPDCINIMMPQDGIGARCSWDGQNIHVVQLVEDSERRFAVLKEICDQTSIHLWANCESFDFGEVEGSDVLQILPRYVDGGISGFMKQLMAVRPYTERVLTFCLTGFWAKPGLLPEIGGKLAVKQRQDYCAYLNNNKMVYRNIALNKPYTASPQGRLAKQLMPDDKQKLTDGKLSGGYCYPLNEDRVVPYFLEDIDDWEKEGVEIFFDVDIIIDLGERTSIDAIRCAKPACLNNVCADRITVSVSDDDKSFKTAGTIKSYQYGWAEIFFTKPLHGRFVKINFYKKGPEEKYTWSNDWLLLDEIQVCQKVNK